MSKGSAGREGVAELAWENKLNWVPGSRMTPGTTCSEAFRFRPGAGYMMELAVYTESGEVLEGKVWRARGLRNEKSFELEMWFSEVVQAGAADMTRYDTQATQTLRNVALQLIHASTECHANAIMASAEGTGATQQPCSVYIRV